MIRRLLERLMSADDWRAFESEQAELFDARRARDGGRAAARRRRSDARRLAWRLVMDRLRRSEVRNAGSDQRGPRPATVSLADLGRDLRHAARSLAHAPGLATTIVLTVGLGLGATTAMVSVIHAVLIAPLPYPDSDNLSYLRTVHGDDLFGLSVADYRAIDAQQTTFASVAAYQYASMTATAGGAAERLDARIVTPSYFTLLGFTPAAGRLLEPADVSAAARSIVLGAAYWRTHFGADPRVVGTSLVVDGTARTIVGVLGQANGPLERDAALYVPANWPTPPRKGPFFLSVLVRPKASVTHDVAEAELRAIDARIFPIWASSYQDQQATWTMISLKTRVLGTVGSSLWLVLAGVGGVLLIACTNAAGLLVARALERRSELVVRSALGASRARLAWEVFVESALVAAAATAVGVAIAVGGIRLVTAFGARYIPRLGEVRLAGPALWWCVLLAAGSAIAIGAFPALHALGVAARTSLGAGTRSVTDAPSARRLRRFLVAAEFACATPLVVAAALIVGSLNRLMHVDVGMDTRHLITATLVLPAAQYPTPAAGHAFWDRAAARFAAWPGVERVAFADSRPPLDVNDINNFDLEDRPTPPGQSQPVCPWITVSKDYFATAGLTLLRGRLFDDRDSDANAPPAIVVDRAWAQRFLGTEDVVGRRLVEGGCTSCPKTVIVGVVGTVVKYLGLDRPDLGTVYTPIDDSVRTRFVFLRTTSEAAAVAPAFSAVAHDLDPNLAVSGVATIGDLVALSTESPRYLSVVIVAFAATALVLSVVGIYGVMTYYVMRHRRDIGIRLALGGTPERVGRTIVTDGLRVVGAGVAIGLGLAVLVTRLMTSVLFGVAPTDPATFAGVGAFMAVIAVAACALPARRAARVEPAVVLRDA